MNTMLTNIDPIRAEIMRLENEKQFDTNAWLHVLERLQGSPCRLADAKRRMNTANRNATSWIDEYQLFVVAVETESVA